MLSQQTLEDSRDPADVYLDKLRRVELQEICRELIVALFRMTVRDIHRQGSTRAATAIRFLRSSDADYLADLIGLDATVLAQELLRVRGTPSYTGSSRTLTSRQPVSQKEEHP